MTQPDEPILVQELDLDTLRTQAIEALKYNDVGGWTRPAPDLYPHQWLWDSCLIAIGLARVDTPRAKQEIRSLLRGQWRNGMLPHIIFSSTPGYHAPYEFWDSKVSPNAPHKVHTSGITQPPLLAEAVTRIGKKLKADQRKQFYREIYPALLAYHQWFYQERDPHNQGLAVLIHPWETGMDNSPPWMEEMAEHHKPWWISFIAATRLDRLVERFRRDTRQVPVDERSSTLETLMLYHVVRRLRRKQYDNERIFLRSHFLIEDIAVNAILIRANKLLQVIAEEINEQLPTALVSSMHRATKALEELWHEEDQQYYSRNFVTRQPLRSPTIATLLPLYAGSISKERAELLVRLLKNDHHYWLHYPVPSVPLSSPYFNHRRYWQGPTWLNMNWMIVDGLRRYGFDAEADHIRERSLELVSKSGWHEYFSPIDGYGAGIQPFSWTAAMALDFIEQHKPKKKSKK